MNYAEFVDTIEIVNYVFGVIFYSLLMFCLIFRTRKDFGAYRHLQIIMVTVDAVYTTAQIFIRERVFIAEGMFAIIPTSQYNINKEVLCSYLALYTLTFVMIDFNFLYRMWALKSPARIYLFSNPSFIILLCAMAFIESAVWYASAFFLYLPTDSGRDRLKDRTVNEFGVNATIQAMIMGDYFLEDGSINVLPLSGVVLSCTVMSICFGFTSYAFSEIYIHLRDANPISKTTIRLQRQLFLTLCLQTIIPFVSLYAPCGFTILLPIFRVEWRLLERAPPLLVSCFLPLDCLAVLLSMTDYRKELARILKCYRSQSVQTVQISLVMNQQTT